MRVLLLSLFCVFVCGCGDGEAVQSLLAENRRLTEELGKLRDEGNASAVLKEKNSQLLTEVEDLRQQLTVAEGKLAAVAEREAIIEEGKKKVWTREKLASVVKPGMSRAEVKAALGPPSDINDDVARYSEVWLYHPGCLHPVTEKVEPFYVYFTPNEKMEWIDFD